MAHILIAEDDEEVRESLENLLQSMGHTVVAAASANAAFKAYYYRPEGSLFDLIITDWHMPERDDGLRVMHYVHRQGHTGPVIIHSGNAEDPRFATFQKTFLRFSSLQWVRKGGDILAAVEACLNKKKPPG